VAPDPSSPRSARERFLETDRYRADREWQRYEGTAQRDLYRQLRERFLSRHARPVAWVLDVGSGPGRFTAAMGPDPATRRVALDIAREMLRQLPTRWRPRGAGEQLPHRVRADGARPPFRERAFGTVGALGNILGFAAEGSDPFFDALLTLLAPGGTLLLEVAPGPGERSRYLHRLPPGTVTRLFRSPSRAVALRVGREGYAAEPRRRKIPGEFRRIDPVELSGQLEGLGFQVEEVMAVAPALGPEAGRIEAIRNDAKAWDHLLEVEEAIGRAPERWPNAAAVLLAATAPAEPGAPPERSGRPSEG
jgi:SAM-dependent methyltransferase